MQLEQPRSGFRRQCHQCTDPNTADYSSKYFAIGSPSENNVRKSAMNSKFCCKYDQNAFAQLHGLEASDGWLTATAPADQLFVAACCQSASRSRR